ncbi:hypothetical protein ACN0TX_12245 [Staphylococcus cohnii]|uniref:hypothetical protein n=1 Tax=Staphylococcus cohnii TaxID=29382 RepID=UPI003AF53E3F
MAEQQNNIKLPSNVIKLFKDLYNLPDDTSGRKVVLYAIVTSIPTKGVDNFVKDFGLDKKQVEKIINKRNRITTNTTKYFKDINRKLDVMVDKENDSKADENNKKLEELLNTMYLMLAENYTSSPNHDEVSNYLNSGKIQTLSESIKKYTDK